MATVKIIAERISSLSYKLAEEHDVTLIAANLVMDDETIKDDNDADGKKFIETFEELDEIPSTATPSIGEVIEVFREATKDSDHAIYISASSKLSTLYDVGLKAAKEMKKEGKDIRVFDSYSTISVCGMYALEASELAKKGKSIDKIMDHLEMLKKEDRVKIYGVLETLKYLEKNGRIGKAKFWMAQIFSFKPIVSTKDGVLEPVGRVRTNPQGLEMIVEKIKANMKRLNSTEIEVVYDYGVSDTYIKEIVAPRIEKEFTVKKSRYAQMSPLIACHLGTRIWGVTVRYL